MADDFVSRARYALAAEGISMRKAARLLSYDPGYLCRVLNGKQRPSIPVAKALDELVGADGALSSLAEFLHEDDRTRVGRSMASPSRVDAGTVRVLGVALAAQRRLDDALGSATVLPTAVAQLATVTSLAKDARGPHRAALVDVAAQWAVFTGWLHVATGKQRIATDRFAQAADYAAESGNGTLLSNILAFKAYAAGKRGEAATKEGLTAAARRITGIHPAQQVYNAFQHARACAQMGEAEEGARLLEEAASLIDSAKAAGEPPPWAYWYTAPFFRLQIGITHARLGRNDIAADMITAGLAGLPESQRAAEWVEEFTSVLEDVPPTAPY